jgi:phage terminase large subunit-like protein
MLRYESFIYMTRGEKICAFIEHYCLIPEGAQVGQPIKLMKFQRKFILDVFDNPHGTSRAYLSVARKNGKSALIAAILLAHLVGPEARQNSQIISGARSRDQASLVFKLAEKMVRLSPVEAFAVSVLPCTARQGIALRCPERGDPGSMYAVFAPTALIQSLTASAMNSGPLSDLM